MSKEQRKTRMKWYKRQPNRFDRFALACLVIIVCAVAYIVVWGIKGDVTPSRESAYDNAKTVLQNAVNNYQSNNNGALPVLNGDVISINGSVCQIIDVCLLLSSQGGILQAVPDGMWASNGSTNDNCFESCEGCKTSHYTWAIDTNGSVRSICISENCEASSQDGYQGVWP